MTTEELHNKFTEYGRNAKEWKRKCAMLLPEIDRQKVWQIKNFSSIFEYAAKLAGFSYNQTADALRILRKIKDKPELITIAERKGINSIKPIVTIATRENAHFWAKKADQMSKHELETYVRDIRNAVKSEELHANNSSTPHTSNFPHPSDSHNPTNSSPTNSSDSHNPPNPSPSNSSHPIHISKSATNTSSPISPETLARLEKLSNGNPDLLLNRLLDQYEKDLENSKPVPKKTRSRHIPIAIRNHVLTRANGRCEVPTCKRPHTQLHHTNRFASDHTHDPDKIVALCDAHHKLIHLGLITENTWIVRETRDLAHLNNYIDHKVQFHRRH